MGNAYGYTIINPDNYIVVDADMRNYAYLGHNTYSLVQGVNYLTMTLQSKPMIVFIRPPTTGWVADAGYVIDSNSKLTKLRLYASTSMSVKIVVFNSDVVRSIPSNSYGLMMYTSTGEVSFSSLDTHPRILNIITSITISSDEVQHAVSNTTNFFSCDMVGFYSRVNSQNIDQGVIGIRAVNTTTLGFKHVYTGTRSTPNIGGNGNFYTCGVGTKRVIEIDRNYVP